MDGGVVIREAVAEDFDAWFALYEEVAAEGTWIAGEAPVDRSGRATAFRTFVEDGDAVMFLAEIGDLLVGNLGIELRNGLADLGMLVRDGYRGRGVGSALMGAAIAWSRDHDAHKVTLQLWPHNGAALALYRKFGFEVEGRLVRHYRRRVGSLWDAVVMGLVLDATSAGSPYADAESSSRASGGRLTSVATRHPSPDRRHT
jgi:RimJ/RimL family protein N-acetyltransferase